MKKGFIIVTFVLGVALVAMLLTKVHLANAMKELGYESKEYHHSAQYYAIPLAA